MTLSCISFIHKRRDSCIRGKRKKRVATNTQPVPLSGNKKNLLIFDTEKHKQLTSELLIARWGYFCI